MLSDRDMGIYVFMCINVSTQSLRGARQMITCMISALINLNLDTSPVIDLIQGSCSKCGEWRPRIFKKRFAKLLIVA